MDQSKKPWIGSELKTRHVMKVCKDGIYRNSLRPLTLEEFSVRFWSQVNKSGENGCWLWEGNKNGTTSIYGTCQYQGKNKKAHRISWELTNNQKIPPGMVACHKCDNKLCVNPEHIFIGTQKDNMQDCKKKGRMRTGISMGEDAGMNKFSESSVRKAVELCKSGQNYAEVSKVTGISRTTLGAIMQGRVWRQVTGFLPPHKRPAFPKGKRGYSCREF